MTNCETTRRITTTRLQRCRSASSFCSRLKICSISLLTEYFKFFLISKANVNEHEILGVVWIIICQTGFSPTDIFDKFKDWRTNEEEFTDINFLLAFCTTLVFRTWYLDILVFLHFFLNGRGGVAKWNLKITTHDNSSSAKIRKA